MKSYYNTNKIDGKKLSEAIKKNKTQEVIISEIFKRNGKPMSASQVFKNYPDKNVTLTSIRRAISNLSMRNIVEKTEDKFEGMYGKSEYLYKLKK